MKQELEYHVKDLPVLLTVRDDSGNRKHYELSPARRGKLGAFLQKVGEPFRSKLASTKLSK